MRWIPDAFRRRPNTVPAVGSGIRWEALQTSGFFQWFGITESLSETQKDGRLIHCKPGGFQDFIDLTFSVTPTGTVSHSELAMDRSWMDGPKTAPFAGDITKSWVLELAGTDPVVKSFGEQLERAGMNLPGVIVHANSVLNGPTPDATTAEALDAYFGRAERTTIGGQSCSLTVDNASTGGSTLPDGRRCLLTWETTP